MVDITDLGGTTYHVDPDLITAVAGPSIEVPRLAVEVFGIDAAPVSTREAPEAIMAAVKPNIEFGRLTRPDGSPILVRGSAVKKVRPPLHSEVSGHRPGSVKLVVYIGENAQPVQEAVETARPVLMKAGSKVFG